MAKAKKAAKKCKGINSKTGKVKKGYKYKKGAACPTKTAKKSRKK